MSEVGSEARVACIGYLEQTSDLWKLDSRFFPSKVGGYPAWLDLQHIPAAADLKCSKCEKPCIFLCQVYAPIDDKDTCFHRTIYIFLCLEPECCEVNSNKNLKVFRCQLPRSNVFYPYEPPVFEEHWRTDISAAKFNKLCIVCGCTSSSHCGKCKRVNYCSREHQIFDWKERHKGICSKESSVAVTGSGLLLPQFELLTEDEDPYSDSDSSSDGRAEEEEERPQAVIENINPAFQDDCNVDGDLLSVARYEQPNDRLLQLFRRRTTGRHPRQVLRYDRGGRPLWLTGEPVPPPPPCQFCGAQRVFEFQVLPQLLIYLGLDRRGQSVDWGTLAVFTCSANCEAGPAYKLEFVWKQDLT